MRNVVSFGLRWLLKHEQTKSPGIYEIVAELIQAEAITACSEMTHF